MKKVLLFLVMALLIGEGVSAAAPHGVFLNTTASTSYTVDVSTFGVVTCHTPSPAFGCRSTVITWTVSANGGVDFVPFDCYSGRMPGATKDLPATRITHVKVTKVTRKKVYSSTHPNRPEQVYYNVR